ncbi:hypothetical protein D3C74_145200 [compost metagenome]
MLMVVTLAGLIVQNGDWNTENITIIMEGVLHPVLLNLLVVLRQIALILHPQQKLQNQKSLNQSIRNQI